MIKPQAREEVLYTKNWQDVDVSTILLLKEAIYLWRSVIVHTGSSIEEREVIS